MRFPLQPAPRTWHVASSTSPVAPGTSHVYDIRMRVGAAAVAIMTATLFTSAGALALAEARGAGRDQRKSAGKSPACLDRRHRHRSEHRGTGGAGARHPLLPRAPADAGHPFGCAGAVRVQRDPRRRVRPAGRPIGLRAGRRVGAWRAGAGRRRRTADRGHAGPAGGRDDPGPAPGRGRLAARGRAGRGAVVAVAGNPETAPGGGESPTPTIAASSGSAVCRPDSIS